MKQTILILNLLFFAFGYIYQAQTRPSLEERVISYELDPSTQNLQFYWKDELGRNFMNIKHLKENLEEKNEDLLFAMNGGMYLKDLSPQGLYIEDGQVLKELNTVEEAYGNFYMQPNGIFYITEDKQAVVCSTKSFGHDDDILYATQSGPMLLIDGEMHHKFRKGSENLHIRNGVGVLPNGHLLFAMSKNKINFYDFASYFASKGCQNALYLDGFVSRTYLPAKDWEQLDGIMGVIIAETQ